MPERPDRLYHFSEDALIRRFAPHVAATASLTEALVWAIDPTKSYLYLFPRDCPRVTFFAAPETSDADRRHFFEPDGAESVVAIESGWLDRVRETRLYRYEFATEGFVLQYETAGYWVRRDAVEPLTVEPVGDLLAALADEDVEIRITPSLWPLYEAVTASTLGFSIIRFRNAAPRRERGVR